MTKTLEVPGASINYEIRGTGPLLLISQSGEGDARRSTDLVDHLVADYTVLTYDRRGLSASRVENPAVTMQDHADDVHQLLAAITDEPAHMLGCSLGAVIGLRVAVDHPGQLSTLVAHEPVAPWLLDDAQAAHHRTELVEIQELYRETDLPTALKEIASVLGIDPTNRDVEPDLTPQPFNEQRIANFDFFIANDFTAIVNDTLSPAALTGTATRIVPATGRTTPQTVFDYQCAVELAKLLGTEIAEFPGGHNGNTTHPRAYAARLREVLD